MDRLRRLFFLRAPLGAEAERVAALEAECEHLRERLRESDEHARSRSELLYELQRQYSSEHFDLQDSMRNLKIERLRNAGMFADRGIVIGRAIDLQARIRSLKERLRKHEPVEDLQFDDAPIVIEAKAPSDPPPDP